MNGETSFGVRRLGHFWTMVALVVAGETVFGLPFHVARFLRPTLLLALDIDNTELGLLQSAYGVVAMLSYFPGGALADRFSARGLLASSLLATAAGGLYYATFPAYAGLWWLHAFWGMSTILLFWGALIRATRESGDAESQGRAYGWLDGGRGLIAALLATVAVELFADAFSADTGAGTEQRIDGLRRVILVYTAGTVLAAGLVWRLVPKQEPRAAGREVSDESRPPRDLWAHLKQSLAHRTVWPHAAIVVCAYVSYKGIDNYSLYASDCFAADEVTAARISTLSVWIRPFAAVAAGYAADRWRGSSVLLVGFCSLAVFYLGMATFTPAPGVFAPLVGSVAATSVCVYGLRGVYFALLEEGGVPERSTGTIVGVVSVIGYTPDVFIGPLGGWLLDSAPGLPGHQHYFGAMAAFMFVGVAASLVFRRLSR